MRMRDNVELWSVLNGGRYLVAVGVAAGALALAPRAHAASALLKYDFNGTGDTATATGSAASPDGSPVLNITGTGAARGADGSGVSGKPGDRSFDNTNSSGIFGAGRAQANGDFDPIDGLSAFTVSGWFKLPEDASESIGRQAGLVENFNEQVANPPQAGFTVTGGDRADSGSLKLKVNGEDAVQTEDGSYGEVGQYVNFAVSYDSASGEAKFYKGLTDQSETLVDTFSYNKGAVIDESQPLILGVRKGGSSLTFSSFNGLLDDVRIYDSAVGLQTLEAARQTDLGQGSSASVPTPTAAAAGLVLMGGLFLRRRRRAA